MSEWEKSKNKERENNMRRENFQRILLMPLSLSHTLKWMLTVEIVTFKHDFLLYLLSFNPYSNSKKNPLFCITHHSNTPIQLLSFASKSFLILQTMLLLRFKFIIFHFIPGATDTHNFLAHIHSQWILTACKWERTRGKLT